jgi:hypothetical protein
MTFNIIHFDDEPHLPTMLVHATTNIIVPFSPLFGYLYPNDALRNIAWTAFQFQELETWPSPPHPQYLFGVCSRLIEQVIRFYCPGYRRARHSLRLHSHNNVIHWHARGWVGPRIWLVEPVCPSDDMLEECGYSLSLAQEFISDEEEEYEHWLVSLRHGRVTLIKSTVHRTLLDALEGQQPENMNDFVASASAFKVEVGIEYDVTVETERLRFVSILGALAEQANEMYPAHDSTVMARSWSDNLDESAHSLICRDDVF